MTVWGGKGSEGMYLVYNAPSDVSEILRQSPKSDFLHSERLGDTI